MNAVRSLARCGYLIASGLVFGKRGMNDSSELQLGVCKGSTDTVSDLAFWALISLSILIHTNLAWFSFIPSLKYILLLHLLPMNPLKSH